MIEIVALIAVIAVIACGVIGVKMAKLKEEKDRFHQIGAALLDVIANRGLDPHQIYDEAIDLLRRE